MISMKTLVWVGIALLASFMTALVVAFYYRGDGTVYYAYYPAYSFQHTNIEGVLPSNSAVPTPPTEGIELLHINYSTLRLQRSGSVLHFEALVNHSKRRQYKCESFPDEVEHSETATEPVVLTEPSAKDIPTIFFITPTYARYSQKVDLTTVCHTLMLVPKVVWIVIEDAAEKTDLVTRLLSRCKAITSVHLNVKTPPKQQFKPGMVRYLVSRGVVQRNTGLVWVRGNCTVDTCNGVVYFGDDDNKYDLRLFEEMRKTEVVSVFPVAFAGGLMFEGPLCKDGKIDKWHTGWALDRHFPIDMAGFAVNLKQVLEHPEAKIGVDKNGKAPAIGYLETAFLENFLTAPSQAECRGYEREALVWHTRTEDPLLEQERRHPSDKHFET